MHEPCSSQAASRQRTGMSTMAAQDGSARAVRRPSISKQLNSSCIATHDEFSCSVIVPGEKISGEGAKEWKTTLAPNHQAGAWGLAANVGDASPLPQVGAVQ